MDKKTGRFSRIGQRVDKAIGLLSKRVEAADDPSDSSSVIPGRPLAAIASGNLEKYGGSIRDVIGRSTGAKYNPIETINLIRDYNPDASLAVWNFLRLVNPGCTLTAKTLPDMVDVDEEGTAMLRTRSGSLLGVYGRDYGGGINQLINVLTLTTVSQGACAGELELDESMTDVLDWCPADPRVVTFRKDQETHHFVPTIDYMGQAYILPREQFRYMPMDPAVGDPYGRCPLWPTMEATFFQVEVLRDLKQVAHTAGHPRMDVAVLEEVAMTHLPAKYLEPGQEEEARTWLNAWLTDIADQYKTLKPDDAFVHYDWVAPSSVDAGRSTFDLNALIKVVEHQVSSALKHLPILLGRTEGQGLAHGTVQWQIFARGIISLRDVVSAVVSWWGTQTLRIWGRQSVAICTFPEIRTQDRLKEAQALVLELHAARTEYFFGFVSQEELSEKFAGHPPVAEVDVDALFGKVDTALLKDDEGEEDGDGEPSEEQEEEEQEQSLLWSQLEEALGNVGGNGYSDELMAELMEVLATDRGTEEQYFDKLPTWMTARIRSEKNSMMAFAGIRRDRVIDDLEEDEDE